MGPLSVDDHRPYRTLTKVLFAAAAERAVILRRGPRNHYCLIAWDTRTDTFEVGQWMKGNVRPTDLSPSGDKLLYFAEQYGASMRDRNRPVSGPYDPLKSRPRQRPVVKPGRKVPRYLRSQHPAAASAHARRLMGSWTAVSTPPYFSALAIWPTIGRWTGGGTFRRDRDIVLGEAQCGMAPIANVPIPIGVSIRSHLTAGGLRPSAYMPSTTESDEHMRIAVALLDAGLKWVDWINLRHEHDMLFAGDGRVFRLHGWRSIVPASYLTAAHVLIDVRDMRFTLLPAPPNAMRW